MNEARQLLHGTCVACGPWGALLRGGSGSGKSDLALRFLALAGEPGLEPKLIADDQVVVQLRGAGELIASAPATLAGKFEVRGLGIVDMPYEVEARLVLVVDLVAPEEVPRMPPEPHDAISLAGVTLPLVRLAAFEASAPLKLKMALIYAAAKITHM